MKQSTIIILFLLGLAIFGWLVREAFPKTVSVTPLRDTVWVENSQPATIIHAPAILDTKIVKKKDIIIDSLGKWVDFYESVLSSLLSLDTDDTMTMTTATLDTISSLNDTLKVTYNFPPINSFDFYLGYSPKPIMVIHDSILVEKQEDFFDDVWTYTKYGLVFGVGFSIGYMVNDIKK